MGRGVRLREIIAIFTRRVIINQTLEPPLEEMLVFPPWYLPNGCINRGQAWRINGGNYESATKYVTNG